MLRYLLAILLLSFPYANSRALPLYQEVKQATDAYLQQHRQDEGITAIAIQIYTPKLSEMKPVLSGYTDNKKSKKISANNLWQIGSITKSFTAVIILQLEKEYPGFSIDDPVSKYLPQYPAWGNITLKQLLNMTSGIKEYSYLDEFWRDFANHPHRGFTPAEIVDYVYKLPSSVAFAPGQGWLYSNTGYYLLGMIIEKVTGQTLEEEMKSRFFNLSTLRLMHSYAFVNGYPDYIYKRMVHGYMHITDPEHDTHFPLNTDVTSFPLSWSYASGNITSTPMNVLMWVKALYTSATLLTAEQRQQLLTCVSMKTGQAVAPGEPQCFGLGIQKQLAPDVYYTYEGSTIGYRVLYVFDPATQMIVVIALNSADSVDHVPQLMKKVIDLIKKHGAI